MGNRSAMLNHATTGAAKPDPATGIVKMCGLDRDEDVFAIAHFKQSASPEILGARIAAFLKGKLVVSQCTDKTPYNSAVGDCGLFSQLLWHLRDPKGQNIGEERRKYGSGSWVETPENPVGSFMRLLSVTEANCNATEKDYTWVYTISLREVDNNSDEFLLKNNGFADVFVQVNGGNDMRPEAFAEYCAQRKHEQEETTANKGKRKREEDIGLNANKRACSLL